jgi:hypothetical protein
MAWRGWLEPSQATPAMNEGFSCHRATSHASQAMPITSHVNKLTGDVLAEEEMVHNSSRSLKRLLSSSDHRTRDEMMRAQVTECFAHEPGVLYGFAALCQIVEHTGDKLRRQALNGRVQHGEVDASSQAMGWRDESGTAIDDSEVRYICFPLNAFLCTTRLAQALQVAKMGTDYAGSRLLDTGSCFFRLSVPCHRVTKCSASDGFRALVSELMKTHISVLPWSSSPWRPRK